MTAGKMEAPFVVLQEERFEVGECVLLAKQAPDAVFAERMARFKLRGFHFGKFFYQGFVDEEDLLTVFPGRLVLMLSDALTQELRHLEMGIAEQGRNARFRCQHLRIERPATVAHQEVGFLFFNQLTNKADGFLRVHGQIGSNHLSTSLKSIAQCHGRHTLAAGKETVEEQYLVHIYSIYDFHRQVFLTIEVMA